MRHRRRSLDALVCVVVTACVFVGAAAVSSPAGALLVNGSITGTVTDASAAPRNNIRVDAFNSYYGNQVGTAITDAAGTYTIANVPPNQTVVRFTDPTGAYVTQYYAGATAWAAATRVVAPLGGSITADATMVANIGDIAGTVTNTSSAPLNAITVTAYNSYYGNAVATTTTAADGTYALTGLAATDYVVMFSDTTGAYATQYYPAAAAKSLASPVTVTATTVTTANAALGVPGSISGQVWGASSSMANIYVIATSTGPVALVGGAVTSASGSYTITGLPAGDYKVLFVDPIWANDQNAGYRPEFYNNIDAGNLALLTDNFTAAPTQTLTPGGSLTNRSAVLVGAHCDPSFENPSADHSGADLAGKDLRRCQMRANFTGATFAGANLTSAWLEGNFTNANMTGANFTSAALRGTFDGANFTSADMTSARIDSSSAPVSMVGARFTGANMHAIYFSKTQQFYPPVFLINLSGAYSGGITGTPAQMPDGWKLIRGYLVGVEAELAGAVFPFGDDLSGLDLHGINLSWSNLNLTYFSSGPISAPNSSNLAGADFSNASFEGVLMTGCDLTNASFVSTIAPRVGFIGANLTGADLASADFRHTWGDANFTNATLANVNLNGTHLVGATLTGVISGGITGVPASLPTGWSLIGGYLVGPGANLSGLDFSGHDFSGANLAGTNFTGANLTNTNFAGANLSGATFTGATIAGTNFAGATFTGVKAGGTTGTPAALPAQWVLLSGFLIGPGANLAGFDLSGLDLSNLVLTGATVTGTNMTGANLTNVLLSGTNLTGLNLTGATLTGVRSGTLTGSPTIAPGWIVANGYLLGPVANLTNANLFAANIGGADLSNATISGVSSGQLTGTPIALPAGAITFNGYLVGPAVSLVNANLTGINLTGVNLSGAVLTNVRAGSVTGTPIALPTGWAVKKGWLVGAGADLRSADLTWSNFTGMDLTGARLDSTDFTFSTLTNANLTTAVVYQTKFAYATLNGAIFLGTTPYGTTFGLAKITGTDFTGVSMSSASFNGATGTPIYVGSTITNSTCPDGSSSNANGYTCQGHPWP